jgi:hypothetical protein
MDDRLAASREALARTGYVELDDGRWCGEHYTATITARATIDFPGATPAYIISYRANG